MNFLFRFQRINGRPDLSSPDGSAGKQDDVEVSKDFFYFNVNELVYLYSFNLFSIRSMLISYKLSSFIVLTNKTVSCYFMNFVSCDLLVRFLCCSVFTPT